MKVSKTSTISKTDRLKRWSTTPKQIKKNKKYMFFLLYKLTFLSMYIYITVFSIVYFYPFIKVYAFVYVNEDVLIYVYVQVIVLSILSYFVLFSALNSLYLI